MRNKLTVILPISEEVPKTIEETKKSILNQKDVDVDLIEIFDDNFARAVNTGVGRARTELCCVVHDDVILPKDDILHFMVGAFAARVEGVEILEASATVPNWEKLSLIEKYFRAWENYKCNIGEVLYTDEKCFMFTKSFWKKIGGLNEEFKISCEDVDLGLRMKERGYKVFNCGIEVWHMHRHTSLEGLLKRNRKLAYGQGMIYRRYDISLGGFRGKSLILPIFLVAVAYSISVIKIIGLKSLLLTPLKVWDNICCTINFWKGFITKKQTL